MICPKCGEQDFGWVSETDRVNKDGQIYRERKCLACSQIYYTVERIDFTGKSERIVKGEYHDGEG